MRERSTSKLHQADYSLILTVFILLITGLIMLSSASAVVSYQRFGNNYYYLVHQLLYGALLGLVFMIVISRIDYHNWRRFATIFLIASIALLILVFIPGIGFAYGGARRWIHIGFISIQPAEIVKLSFILYLATWLEKREKGIQDFKSGFFPFITMVATIGFLIILQPDLGTMLVVIISAIIIYFVAGGSLKHLAILGVVGLILLLIVVQLAPYRLARFTVFLNPEHDPQGIGYQVNQALLAVGSGGIFGQGLGKSIQKYNYLPEVTGDSIFAVIAEELGFIRILFIVALFLAFSFFGYRIVKRAPDIYGKLVATGIVSWITFQALINMMAIIGLLPLTGIPLPFISYGSSALTVSLAGIGILINISKQTK